MDGRRVVPVVFLVLLACGIACNSTDSAEDDERTPGAGGSGGHDGTGGSGGGSGGDAGSGGGHAAPDCSAFGPVAATLQINLEHGGRSRQAYVRIPDTYNGTRPIGLIFNFHGYGRNAEEQEFYTGLSDPALTWGFAVAFPTGINNSWNGGACCGTAAAENVDDVGFVSALIDEISKQVCIDPARVFATGMSNGGFMSYRLGCELSERIAAIAPVAGVRVLAQCAPTRPVPVLHFHGTADLTVAYRGNASRGFLGAPESVNTFAAFNGCTGDPVETYRNGDVTCTTYKTCRANGDATLCTVEGGGHTWPGSIYDFEQLGHVTRDIDASATMVDFFRAHRMP